MLRSNGDAPLVVDKRRGRSPPLIENPLPNPRENPISRMASPITSLIIKKLQSPFLPENTDGADENKTLRRLKK
jgi:hypothetical protein